MARQKVADRIDGLFKAANGKDRQKWQSKAQQGYDFYLDEQLTKDEKDALEESGMPTFKINRVTPIIEIMKYFITANNPRWKGVGVEGSDANIAQVHSDVADYCWGISNGKSVFSGVINDTLTKGAGYFFIDIDQDADNGKGDVVFKRIDSFDVYPDPMSRDFLLRDASFITVRKQLPREQLKQMFPEYKRKINKASQQGGLEAFSLADRDDASGIIPEDVVNAVAPDGSKDDILPYSECYEKIRVPFVNLTIKIYPDKDEIDAIMQISKQKMKDFKEEMEVSTKEQILKIQQMAEQGEIIEERAILEINKAQKQLEQSIRRKQSELEYATQEELGRTEEKIVSEKEYNILIENEEVVKSIVDSAKYYETRVKVTCTIGSDILLYEYVLPFRNYPIVPIPYLYTGTPYPISAVIPMIGKQQEINKAHQVMLHNANLASNLRWQYEEGSIPEEDWEQYSSSPGALLKYRQGFNAPTAIMPAPINNAFFTVVQEGKSDMEYIAGIPSAMMGFAQEQAETYRGLLANDEFGTRRIKAWMGSILEPALEHVGQVFKEIAQTHYKYDKVFRIVQPNAGGGQTEKETRINIPIYNDYGEAIGKWSDYASARFDVRIIAGATMPLNRWALVEEYFKWFQAGLIDDIAMLGETDVRGKEKILERKSLYSQLQGQVQQLTDNVKEKDGTIETLSRQLVQAGIRHNVDVGSKEVEKDVLETEAQQKYYRKLLQDKQKEISVETKKSLQNNKTK